MTAIFTLSLGAFCLMDAIVFEEIIDGTPMLAASKEVVFKKFRRVVIFFFSD
jgi:hypothetical protein